MMTSSTVHYMYHPFSPPSFSLPFCLLSAKQKEKDIKNNNQTVLLGKLRIIFPSLLHVPFQAHSPT